MAKAEATHRKRMRKAEAKHPKNKQTTPGKEKHRRSIQKQAVVEGYIGKPFEKYRKFNKYIGKS